jgi:signal transduction histidine kinase
MKISLSYKIIGMLFLFFTALFICLSVFNVTVQKKDLIKLFIERGKVTAYSLEFGLNGKEDLENKDKLLLNIQKNMQLDSEIINVSYNLLRENSIVTYVSSNPNKIAQIPDAENAEAMKKDALLGKTFKSGGLEILRVTAPMRISGQQVGAIQMDFSLKSINQRVASMVRTSILVYVSMIIVFILLLHLFFQFIVTSPVKKITEVARKIAKGDFAARVKVNSKDEIGELGQIFNQMTKNLLQSYKKVEENVKELSIEHGKLFSLVESVRLGVVMVDLSLNVILANPAAKKILGKTSSEEITFKILSEKIKGNVDISQALSFYVKSGKPLNVQEAVIDEKYYRLFMSPVRDIVEKIFIGAVVIMEDITEEKRLDKMRTEIVSITSHQLRTPSTIIKGNLEMLLAGDIGEVPKDQKEILQDVYLGNERMIRLINDLMDAAKIDEGKFKLVTEPAQLENLVGEIAEEVSLLAKEKKVELVFNHPGKALSKVNINIQRVKQVLQNLTVNAIQYSAVGDKGRVVMEAEEDENFIKFIVKDNGVGIPRKEQDKLFERFFRGSNVSRMDPGGGSGLGLYIAKAVVEQGGGSISFVSEENQGTTFTTTFPRLK